MYMYHKILSAMNLLYYIVMLPLNLKCTYYWNNIGWFLGWNIEYKYIII